MSTTTARREAGSTVDTDDTDLDATASETSGKKEALSRKGESAVKVKTLAFGAAIVALVAALCVLGWQLHSKSDDLSNVESANATAAHAEQVALDYATAAAQMDFKDLGAWRGRLTQGTSPELTDRLNQAATSMEQIITPLQWISTATPVAAKVRTADNGSYTVDCFVSVMTKNSQAPEGIQSTASYQLTLDSKSNWLITDIGSIGLPLAGAPQPR